MLFLESMRESEEIFKTVLMIMFAVSLFYILSSDLLYVYSQTVTTTTITNYTTIFIPAPRPFIIKQTSISFRVLNQSFIYGVYSCYYIYNYTSDCVTINVTLIDNDTNAVIGVWNITFNSTYLGEDLEYIGTLQLLRGMKLFNVSNVSTIKVVMNTLDQIIITYLYMPTIQLATVNIGGQAVDLTFIIMFSLIAGLSLKGRLREAGVGMVVAGFLSLYIPFIGIYFPLYISALLIIIGLILIYISGR
jgi:hypothetical protein